MIGEKSRDRRRQDILTFCHDGNLPDVVMKHAAEIITEDDGDAPICADVLDPGQNSNISAKSDVMLCYISYIYSIYKRTIATEEDAHPVSFNYLFVATFFIYLPRSVAIICSDVLNIIFS
jgi:hypothetical protein